MAYLTTAHSPKEWTIGIGEEVTVGTAITSYNGIEIESISFPTINDGLRVTEKRSGSVGPFLNTNDLVYLEEGGTHEISISGILNKTLLPILVENAVGESLASNRVVIDHNHAPAHFLHGATSSGSHNTVAFCIEGPQDGAVADSYTMKGCVITSLTFSAESSAEGGRFKFDLTAQTRSAVTTTAVAVGVNAIAAPAETYLNMGDFTVSSRVFGKECILDTFGLTIENPVQFLGNTTGGSPEAYQRGYPETNATANCSVKYDANTATFLNSWRTQGIAGKTDTDVVDDGVAGLYLANHLTWASATVFGIKMDNVMIAEQPTMDESDYMKVSCVLKAVNDELSTSDILDIIVTT